MENSETQLRGRELSVALTVNDLAKSQTWYVEVLGFEVRERFEREGVLMAVSLKAGDCAILLTQDNGARGVERVKGEGFSIQITTEQDIDALADRVRRHGASLASEPETAPWGQRAFRLLDPDGFRFTISSPRPQKS